MTDIDNETPLTFTTIDAVQLDCTRLGARVDRELSRRCSRKRNHLQPCDKDGGGNCSCIDDPSRPKVVDLIILIDGSGSMTQAAQAVNNAAAVAIRKAKEECPSDLRVTWLTVDASKPGTSPAGTGGWPGTNFTQTHEQYLRGIGATGPFFHDQTAGGSPVNEQGADAVADLAQFYDWRPDACRAIFYISDTTLDAGFSQAADDVAATANAIAVANANDVTVFAHFVSPFQTNNPAATQADYQNLTSATGGQLAVGAVNQDQYVELVKTAICRACAPKCKHADIPVIKPCISISWGDSKCDCIETDDTEILCITICNCYANVSFSNVVLSYVFVSDGNGGTVPTLPDGSPSVEVHPLGPICFGDIGPCRDGRPSCVSREVVLLTRGARGGKYQLRIGAICYGVNLQYQSSACFDLELCQDR
jgi:hypothetical protein